MASRFIKLFTREEPIAGLEISDTALRLSVLEFSEKEKNAVLIKASAEELLPENVIVEGAIQDKAAFEAAVKNLVKKIKTTVHYVVVSIPSDTAFSSVSAFPKTIRNEKLEQAMKLSMSYQLPVKLEDVYMDWEKVEKDEANEVFLVTAPRTAVDAYVDVLNASGLRVVAVETHPISLVRVLANDPKSAKLIVLWGKTSTTLCLKKGADIRLIRTLPTSVVPSEGVADEVEKMLRFAEAENLPVPKIIQLGDGDLKKMSVPVTNTFTIQKTLQDRPDAPIEDRELVSLGAAWRGLIPRSDDTIVSLMSFGTEDAYEQQKAAVLAEFISGTLIAVSILFVVVFLGGWLLLLSIQENYDRQISTLSSLPEPAEAVALQIRATAFNRLIAQTSPLAAAMTSWSPLIQEIHTLQGSAITINAVSFPSPDAGLSLTGIAQDRPALNAFKKALAESPFLEDVQSPITHIFQRENIPFSATFRLKDPALLSAVR